MKETINKDTYQTLKELKESKESIEKMFEKSGKNSLKDLA